MASSDMADPASAIAFAVDEDAPLTSARLEQLAAHGVFGSAPALAPSWQLTPEEVRAVQSIHDDARARNTDRSYATARRYWQAWYRLRYQEDLVLPVAPDAVLRFIIDHVLHWDDGPAGPVETHMLPPWIEAQLVEYRFKRPGPWRVNTIEHRVSVLSSMHDETRDAAGEALPNPCRDPYIVRLLREVRRAHAKHGHVEVRRDAATVNVLQAMLAHCDPETLRGIRDTAVLLVGFNSGGRRRSEIVGLTWERLVADGENFLWKLGQTKTSDGKDVDVQKPIQGKAAQALRAWRVASGIRTGHVFREIAKGDRMTERPMSDQAVHRLVQRLAQQADLAGVWGAHSLRAGFITEAGAQGLALQEAMELSDHKTVLVASRYYRTGAASTSPAANLAAGIALPDRADLVPVSKPAEARPATKSKPTPRLRLKPSATLRDAP